MIKDETGFKRDPRAKWGTDRAAPYRGARRARDNLYKPAGKIKEFAFRDRKPSPKLPLQS